MTCQQGTAKNLHHPNKCQCIRKMKRRSSLLSRLSKTMSELNLRIHGIRVVESVEKSWRKGACAWSQKTAIEVIFSCSHYRQRRLGTHTFKSEHTVLTCNLASSRAITIPAISSWSSNICRSNLSSVSLGLSKVLLYTSRYFLYTSLKIGQWTSSHQRHCPSLRDSKFEWLNFSNRMSLISTSSGETLNARDIT